MKGFGWGIILLVLILSVSLVSIVLLKPELLSIGAQPISIGAIVTAIGQANYVVAGDPTMSGSFWTVPISVQPYGNGTPLVGTKLTTTDGKSSQDQVSVSVQVNSQSCNYPIEHTGQLLYSYELKQTDCGWLSSGCISGGSTWAYNHCAEVYGSTDLTGALVPWQDPLVVSCIYKHSNGVAGRTTLIQGDFQTNLTITANVNGKIETVNLKDGQTGITSDNFLRALWTGYNLQYQCPSSSGITPLYIGGSWNTYNAVTTTDYLNAEANNQVTSCLSALIDRHPANVQACLDTYNNKRNLIYRQDITLLGGAQAVTTSSSDSGQVILYSSRLLSYPQLVLKIDADYLSIAESVGKPSLSGGFCNVQTGVPTSASATLTNIGEATGTFLAELNCPNAVKITASTAYTLTKGQSTQIYIPITGESAAKINSACTLKATDLTNPNNFDTKTVDCTVSPIVICTPGQVICDGRDIKTCNSGGSGYTVTQACKNSCAFNSTTQQYYCVGEDQKPTPFDWNLVFFAIAVIIVIAVVIFATQNPTRRKHK